MTPFDLAYPQYLTVDTVQNKGSAPGNLLRGPKPTVDELQTLCERDNVKTVINLEVGWYDIIHDQVFLERDMLLAWGIDYIHRPMGDVIRPTAAELTNIVNMIKYRIQYGNVLVHCLHGEDRTGMVCAAWRILVNGWTVDAAINEMYAQGFHRIPYFYWVPVLRGLK